MGLYREGIVSVAAVVVGDSVAIHHHPPIVLGAVSITDNAVVGISRAGIELGAVRQTVGLLVGTVTAETSMSDVAPLLFIGMAVFAISFLIIQRVEIPEPTLGKEQPKYERSPLAFQPSPPLLL